MFLFSLLKGEYFRIIILKLAVFSTWPINSHEDRVVCKGGSLMKKALKQNVSDRR